MHQKHFVAVHLQAHLDNVGHESAIINNKNFLCHAQTSHRNQKRAARVVDLGLLVCGCRVAVRAAFVGFIGLPFLDLLRYGGAAE
jgi:hypothetical protein